MRKRRTIFYGRRADRTPKKDGDNPWVPERRGEPLPHEEVHLRFSNRTVTQFGGYLLWHEFCQKIGLQARLARHIRMSRGPLAFTAPELARFLLDAKFLGAQRLMHVDTLRLDPLLCGLSGIEDLPSGKTLGRFLKEHEERHLGSLDHLTGILTNELWKLLRRTVSPTHRAVQEKVVLDYDSSTFTIYGKQEGADRGRSFRKKDKPGYQPRFAFLGGLGIAVHRVSSARVRGRHLRPPRAVMAVSWPLWLRRRAPQVTLAPCGRSAGVACGDDEGLAPGQSTMPERAIVCR